MDPDDDAATMDPPDHLIPPALVATALDRRVERAYQLARAAGGRRYVWVADDDTIPIGSQRPPGKACVVVSPERWALTLAAGAEEP